MKKILFLTATILSLTGYGQEFNNGIETSTGFSIQEFTPIDERFVASDSASLYTLPYIYEGMFSVDKETWNLWIYDGIEFNKVAKADSVDLSNYFTKTETQDVISDSIVGLKSSLYIERFNFDELNVEQEFTLAFEPTQVERVTITNSDIFADESEFTISETTLTVLSELKDGDVVRIWYWNGQTNTTSYSKNESDGLFYLKVDGENLEEVVYNIADGTGGKAYPDLTTAMAVDPLPADGTIFTIDESNEEEKGIYAYDSGEVEGYRFVRGFEDLAEENRRIIDVIRSSQEFKRVNSGENSAEPQLFPTTVETSGVIKVDVVADSDSPTKDLLGYKRIFSNNLTEGTGSKYISTALPLGSSRPDRITLGFWLNRPEFEDIYGSGTLVIWLGGKDYFISNITQIFSGVTKSLTMGGGAPTQYNGLKLTIKEVESSGDWSRVEISFYDIDWKEAFVGTTILFYYTFTGVNSYEKQLQTSDWTLLFDDVIQEGLFYGGENYNSNTPTLGYLQEQIDDLNERLEESVDDLNQSIQDAVEGVEEQISETNSRIDGLVGEQTLRVKLISNTIYIANPYDETYELVKEISTNTISSFTRNPTVKLFKEYLVEKGENITIPEIELKTSTDDSAPSYMNGSYVGGGHSWNQGRSVVATGHGKTYADIGSVYKDTSDREFVILRIVDANTLWMISKNQATDGYSYTFVAPEGTLTYLSNGSNTGSIGVESSSLLGNTYSTEKAVSLKILIDNKEITEFKDYSGSNVKIIEEYYALDLPSIIQDVINNRPEGGYTENIMFNSFDTEPVFKNTIVYEVQQNGVMLITTTFRTYKKVNFNFNGFIQFLTLAEGGVYIPKTKPFTVGERTYNLNLIEDWSTPIASSTNLTSTYWEDEDSPPDRVINLNDDVVFQTGYLTDRGVGLNRKDRVATAINLNPNDKIYPYGDSNARVLDENSFMSCVNFRSFQNPEDNPEGRTSLMQFEIGGETFIYIDYHEPLTDYIEVSSSLTGRKIEVYENVGDVILMSDVVSGDSIEILSTVEDGDYGFIILKIR